MNIAEFVYTALLTPPLLRRCANRLLLSIIPRTIKAQNAIVHLNPNDPVVSGALTLRVYERYEIAFFLKWIEPRMTFIDVGANVGLYSALALSLNNFSGRLLCVEPDSQSRYYLERTIQSNRRAEQLRSISISSFAASDQRETITLYKNSRNKGDNRIYPNELCDEQEIVQADTLDSICRSEGINEVDFLKVDVQGAEAKLFRGASSILSQSPDCIVMFEFWPYGLSSCGNKPQECLSLLQSLGFTLYELFCEDLRLITDWEDFIHRCPGRVYKNLIGLKGRYKNKLTPE